MSTQIRFLISCVALWSALLPAQETPPQRIAIRSLNIVAASDSITLRGVAATRELRSGGVLVNDAASRRLGMFNEALTHFTILADTSTRAEYSYGLQAKAGSLIPYIADSTMFADDESQLLLVIDPNGTITNVIAPVRAYDLKAIAAGTNGLTAFDSKGRMVYGASRYFDWDKAVVSIAPADPPRTMTLPDSAPIVRADFDERSVDTIAMFSIPVQKTVVIRSAQSGSFSTFTAFNPLPSGDDWTMLADGTIAIVRAKDYHVDWLAPDGKHVSTPKMPFDWKAISPEEKRRMVDSVKHGLDEASARDFTANSAVPGVAATPRLNFTVDAADIPDFYPPVRQGTTRADFNNRIWILPSTSKAARDGLLYDVVNRQGEVMERVQLPAGRALVGFGTGDVVYLSHVLAPNKAVLERAVIVP